MEYGSTGVRGVGKGYGESSLGKGKNGVRGGILSKRVYTRHSDPDPNLNCYLPSSTFIMSSIISLSLSRSEINPNEISAELSLVIVPTIKVRIHDSGSGSGAIEG